MRLLSLSESAELSEHFSHRPDIWLVSGSVWARKIGTNQHGVLVGFGPAAGRPLLSTLTITPVAWDLQTSEDYVSWLLEKYTAHSYRLQLLRLLAPVVHSRADVQTLSVQLAEMQGLERKFHKPRLLRRATAEETEELTVG